jgi:AAA ATPase-like protein
VARASATGQGPGNLVGREVERAAIGRLLDAVVSGHGGGLVVRGEPGIGKSALLADATARAAKADVLRMVGVETESALAYAGLHRLLWPVIDRVDGLSATHADALRVTPVWAPARPRTGSWSRSRS